MPGSTTRLTPDHPANEVEQANTPNVLSEILAWEVPNNTVYYVGDPAVNPQVLGDGEILPVVKLLQSGGAEIDGDSLIAFAVRAPKEETPRFAGHVRYHVFRDLKTSEQRGRDYLQSVLTQLRGKVELTESNRIEVHLNSPDTVDLTEAGTSFELPVIELRP